MMELINNIPVNESVFMTIFLLLHNVYTTSTFQRFLSEPESCKIKTN